MTRIETDLFSKRKMLAEALDVGDATVRRWANGTSQPLGVAMISLRYYLDFLGYRVSELVSLPEIIKSAGKMVAFRVISSEEMARIVDYVGTDSLMVVLRGGSGLSHQREDSFQKMIQNHSKELADKLASLPLVIPKIGDVSSTTTAQQPAVSVPENQKRDKRFGTLVANLQDFASYYCDPNVPETVREQLRDNVGQDKIFALKNLLARLCGSRAFHNN